MMTSTTSAAPRFPAAMSPTAFAACWRRLNSWCVLRLFLLAACRTTPQQSLELVRRSEPLLGTFVTISVYASTRAEGIAAISTAFDEFRRIDALMSLHRADSELNRVNQF